MAIPVNTPAESTLNLGATPSMLQRGVGTPVAITSAGNTGAGVAMQNPTMAPTESGLDALTGAGLGGLIGMMLDKNSKPSTTTKASGLINPIKTGTGTGSSGTGSTGSTGSTGAGSTGTGTTGGTTGGTSNQSDTMLGGMTGNSNSITTGYLQDSNGNLYKDNGDGTASLYYESIGNTNYIYQGPQFTQSASGTDIYPGAVMDQQGVQIAPNFNWYVNNASDVTAPTSDLTSSLGSALDWNSWYTPTDTGGSPYTPSDTSNTDQYTYIDTTGGPTWKNGGLATPMYANGGQVKGYAAGDLVTATDATVNPTVMASNVGSTPTSFTDQVVANQMPSSTDQIATPLASAAGTTGTTAGTSPLSSITDLLTQHTGISGAVIGALLGQLLGGKSSGNVNTGVDMSKVAQIAPRTTNFGIGPTNFAPYSAYGTPPSASPAYGGLFSNLGVSGYGSNANPLLSRRVSTGKSPFYTFGSPVDPSKYMADGGTATSGLQVANMPMNANVPNLDGAPSNSNVPKLGHRNDYRAGAYVEGPGDGQSDDIPAMLADGEYVIDAETVAQLGNGSNKAGSKVLDKFRENIRSHKRNTPHDKIPPKSKSPLAYLKGTK